MPHAYCLTVWHAMASHVTCHTLRPSHSKMRWQMRWLIQRWDGWRMTNVWAGILPASNRHGMSMKQASCKWLSTSTWGITSIDTCVITSIDALTSVECVMTHIAICDMTHVSHAWLAVPWRCGSESTTSCGWESTTWCGWEERMRWCLDDVKSRWPS